MKKKSNYFVIFGQIHMKLWLIIDLYEPKANIQSRACFNDEKLFGHVINLSQITCKRLTSTYLSNRLVDDLQNFRDGIFNWNELIDALH